LFAGKFKLTVKPGEFTDSEIIVMLGENGTGKTTFIKMLAGKLEPDEGGEILGVLASSGCLFVCFTRLMCSICIPAS
jgi:translation initiation factor RLI1